MKNKQIVVVLLVILVSGCASTTNKISNISNNVSTNVAITPKIAPIPTSENCIDNTKKVAVYMAATTNRMYQQSTGKNIQIPVTYDPLCTAMFYEYNLTYLGDSNITNQLTTENYDLLIVPTSQMSDAVATAINTYISKGGSVWFLNDPSLTPTGYVNANRITILGTANKATIGNSSIITVISTDDISRGLPTSFNPVGASSGKIYARVMSNSGSISGMNYKVLMAADQAALLIKYENSTTGAHVIYSNPAMFISGGECSYFNATTATKLFLQTKAWLLKLMPNSSDITITYPKSDKQFTITSDDETAAPWEGTRMDTMFNMEKANGLIPQDVNSFFIIPSANATESELQYYATNGDTHTLHPHVITFWDDNQSVSTYQGDIKRSEEYINNAMGVSNYGFYSFRFPMTTFCANAMQAVSNTGLLIDSSAGLCTDSVRIGTTKDNNVFFPKQVIINSMKANMVEMELPSSYDIDAGNGTTFYNDYNAYLPYYRNVNFPSDFVVGCHIQGAGSNVSLTNGLAQIIESSKNTDTMYANFSTLANYLAAVKSAKITASVSGNTTTVTVVSTKTIIDFTIKVASASSISATCDGTAIPSSGIRQDGNAWYITKTVDTGTHTFEITTA